MSSNDEIKADEKKAEETPEATPETTPEAKLGDSQDADAIEGALDLEDDEDVASEDSLTFSNGVIEKIVALAMRDVPGVVGMKGGFINRVQDAFGVRDSRKGVIVEVTPDSAVRVNISVFMAYGAYAPQVFEDVKHAVVDAVTGMTGLDVAGVNLRIEDVLTPEEVEARSPRLPASSEPERLPEGEDVAEPGAEAETEAELELPADEEPQATAGDAATDTAE